MLIDLGWPPLNKNVIMARLALQMSCVCEAFLFGTVQFSRLQLTLLQWVCLQQQAANVSDGITNGPNVASGKAVLLHHGGTNEVKCELMDVFTIYLLKDGQA